MNFVIFSTPQGSNREIMSEKELMTKYPDAQDLEQAADMEANTWDIYPIQETVQAFETYDEAVSYLRKLIKRVVPDVNFDDLNMRDIELVATDSFYYNQKVYYYLYEMEDWDVKNLVEENTLD